MRTETLQYESGALQPQALWPIYALGAFFILLVVIGTAINKRKKRAFEAISAFIQGEAGGNAFLQNFYFRGTYKSRRLLIKYEPGGKNSPSYLSAALEGPPFLFDLKVSGEDFLKGAFKSLGFLKEVKTGDEVFDARFHLASEVGDLAGRYLASPAVRERITALFDSGAYSLELLPGGKTIGGLIRYRKQAPELDDDLSMQRLTPVLDALDALASERNGKEFFGRPATGSLVH